MSIIRWALSLEIALCASLLLKSKNVQSHHSFWMAPLACFTGSFCRSGFLIITLRHSRIGYGGSSSACTAHPVVQSSRGACGPPRLHPIVLKALVFARRCENDKFELVSVKSSQPTSSSVSSKKWNFLLFLHRFSNIFLSILVSK